MTKSTTNRASAKERYTAVAKTIHWLMAALIMINLLIGWSMEHETGAKLEETLSSHTLVGLLVFGLVLLRLSWRIANPPPALPSAMSRRQRLAAHGVHVALYTLMILVPITGLLAATAHERSVTVLGIDIQAAMSLVGHDGFDLKITLHWISVMLLVLLTIGHIAAALVHQFLLKDGLLWRMLPQRGAGQ